MRATILVATLALLCGCGSASAPVNTGPRIEATLAATWPARAPARQAAFSRDGRLLATSDASGLITVRNTADWHFVRQLHHPGGATTVAFSKNGSDLFSGGYDGAIRSWDLRTGTEIGLLKTSGGTIWSLDVSPDGMRLAAGGEDATIRVWNLAAPGTPTVLSGHQRNVWEVRFSPDGKTLASGSFDKTARLWDVATGRPLKIITGHAEAVVGLAFSPDGKVLATSGDDSTIRVWRLPDGAPVRTIQVGNHTYKLAFSSDGRWLISGGRAHGDLGTFWHQLTGGGGSATPVQIWRTSDAALIASLPGTDDIAHVAISPDGQWLAVASEDQRVRLWRLTPKA